uniref:Uncharacterized protein n=1 Tax=Chenopodium quinoa TaxID=63459 RepID=A0A803M1M5_CHEQI
MTQLLNLSLLPSKTPALSSLISSSRHQNFAALSLQLRCNGRFSCLFSDNRKQYLVAAKGDLLLAVIINPLLFALRSTKNGFTYVTSMITGRSFTGNDAQFEEMKLEAAQSSAKERITKKWGSD